MLAVYHRIKGSRSNCLHERRNRHTSALDTGFLEICLSETKQLISKHFPDCARQILFLYSGYLESEKTRSGIDISTIKHRRKDYNFDDFKCLITLYYISRISSKRNTASSFKCIIFIRGDRQRGINQLIYC